MSWSVDTPGWLTGTAIPTIFDSSRDDHHSALSGLLDIPFGEGAVNLTATAMTSPQPLPDAVAALAPPEKVERPKPKPSEYTAGPLPEPDSHAEETIAPAPYTMAAAIQIPASHAAEALSAVALAGEDYRQPLQPLQPLAPSLMEDAAIPQVPENSSAPPIPFSFMTAVSQQEAMQYEGLMKMNALPFLGDQHSGLPQNLGFNPQAFLDMPPGFGTGQTLPEETTEPLYYKVIDESTISAYAKLQFDDGPFFMNTFSVILGRDQVAANACQRREKRASEREREREREQSGEAHGHRPRTPPRYKGSIVSEKSGFMRNGDDESREEREARRLRKASKKSKSTGSSSRSQNEGHFRGPSGTKSRASRRRSAIAEEIAPVNPTHLHPDPYECPIIPIHPGNKAGFAQYKVISKKHMKIAFNHETLVWEAMMLGRNGGFVNGTHHFHGETVPLENNSQVQIGSVAFKFILPDTPVNEPLLESEDTYQEPIVDRYYEGGKEMSFNFEDTPRDGVFKDTSEEPSSDEELEAAGATGGSPELQEDSDAEGEDDSQQEESEEGIEKDSHGGDDSQDIVLQSRERSATVQGDEQRHVKIKSESQSSPLRPEKKRGPGRPPKNGIMSKREEQLAKKEALAQAQQKEGAINTTPTKKVDASGAPLPVKNKVGRPRKHPRPDTPPVQREKRKYTKRKPKEPKEPGANPEGEGEGAEKEKKEKKIPKRVRSPTPTYDINTLTDEQKSKPNKNYVTLLWEALSESPDGMMSLPQIYNAIMKKYPFFVVGCATQGWQSSVRHNLGQNKVFEKADRDGKGWTWRIAPGATIEKEKKKKMSPQPPLHPGHMYHQPIQQAGYPPMMPGYGYPPPGHMGPPPGYPPNHQIPPGYAHPQYMPPYPPGNGQMPPGQYPPNPYPPGQYPPYPPPPNGYPPPLPIAPQLVAPHGAAQYSSPYAKPPTQSQPQSNTQPPAGSEQQAVQTPPLNAQPAMPEQKPSIPAPQQSTAALQPPPSQQVPPPTQPQQAHQPQQSQQPLQAQHAPQVQEVLQAQMHQQQPPPAPKSQSPTKPREHEQPPKPVPSGVQQASSDSQAGGKSNEKIEMACRIFRTAITKGMGSHEDKIEEVIDYVINEVLSRPNESLPNFSPTQIQRIPQLKNALYTILGQLNVESQALLPRKQNDSGSKSSPAPAAQMTGGSQAAHPPPSFNSNGVSKTTSTIARPTFSGQGGALSRPPMRTNAGSVGNASASGRSSAQSCSPASAPIASGASASKLLPKEQERLPNGLVAAQTVPRQEMEGDVPMANMASIPSLTSTPVLAPASNLGTASPMNANGASGATASAQIKDNGQLAGQKRSRDNDETDERRDFKRMESSNGSSQPVKA